MSEDEAFEAWFESEYPNVEKLAQIGSIESIRIARISRAAWQSRAALCSQPSAKDEAMPYITLVLGYGGTCVAPAIRFDGVCSIQLYPLGYVETVGASLVPVGELGKPDFSRGGVGIEIHNLESLAVLEDAVRAVRLMLKGEKTMLELSSDRSWVGDKSIGSNPAVAPPVGPEEANNGI